MVLVLLFALLIITILAGLGFLDDAIIPLGEEEGLHFVPVAQIVILVLLIILNIKGI